MSVNADKLVQIIPRIIEGGTPGLTFAGLILSQSELLPAGRVVQRRPWPIISARFRKRQAWLPCTSPAT